MVNKEGGIAMDHLHKVQRFLIIAVLFISVISAVTVFADKPGTCKKPDGGTFCKGSTGTCYCDSLCLKYNDCCSDFKDVCNDVVINSTKPYCGDGYINQPEETCDGKQFNPGGVLQTCQTFGFDSGYLSCEKDCVISLKNCYDYDNQSNQSCIDSDGGINLFVSGTVYKNGTKISDHCIGSGEQKGYLTEYYCDGNEIQDVMYGPNEGCQECVGGACITPKPQPIKKNDVLNWITNNC